MAEYQYYDGEAYITMDIIAINEKKNEIQLAITNRGRITVTTYDLYTDLPTYFITAANRERLAF